jgi:copper oxidase (laccase) domain-containing protein
MLQRQVSPDGVVFYVSPLLRSAGVPHAFSTRIGGISRPPFDSMNLGNPSGCDVQDDYENVWANCRRLMEASGCGAARELCRVHQVHGPAVVRVRRGEPFDCGTKADAIVGDDPGRVLSVRVADCVPVLLATGDGSTVAAVHAGWRGVIAGVVPAAIQEMLGSSDGSVRSADPDPANDVPAFRPDCPLQRAVCGERHAPAPDETILAAVGPCIGSEAFEVGPEVLAEFDRVFGAAAPVMRLPDGKGLVDLRRAIRLQLIAAGVTDDRIDLTDRCTYRDADEFFSHRRDKGVTGRMAAIVGVRMKAEG